MSSIAAVRANARLTKNRLVAQEARLQLIFDKNEEFIQTKIFKSLDKNASNFSKTNLKLLRKDWFYLHHAFQILRIKKWRQSQQ